MRKFYFRIFLISLSVAFITISSNAQALLRKRINFDDGWKFHFGNAADPEKDFNYGIANIFSKSAAASGTAIDTRFKDSAWQNVTLPHDWAVELPFVKVDNFDVMAHGYKPVGGLFPATSIGWYRKHFSVNRADSGQRFQIQFDGVARDATVWLNGFYVGNNKSGYVGIAYDVTDFINFDKENILVVRADATQYEGWFYEGAGIYRHVWLNQYNNLSIKNDGIFAYSKMQGNKATVTVESTIDNKNYTTSSCTVNAYLTTKAGEIVARSKVQPAALEPGETKMYKQSIIVTNPNLWSLEDPYLYRVVVELSSDGNIIDDKKIRFGIRTIDIKPDGVFLNGKHVKLHGVNNHQDHAGVGSALPDYLQYYRVGLLKNLGANAYRTSHNAPTPELLDACDSLGMLVLDEQRLLTSSPEYLDQFESLVKRDRNHASLFLYGLSAMKRDGYKPPATEKELPKHLLQSKNN